MVRRFDIVVALDENLCIGKDGKLPWRLRGDLKYFRELTITPTMSREPNAVIMGRKTWESLPTRARPLADRVNLVLTKQERYRLPEGVLKAGSLDQALMMLSEFQIRNCFVIGGGELYREAIEHQCLGLLYVTEIQAAFYCDAYFPEYRGRFKLESESRMHEENGLNYCFKVFSRQGSQS